MYCRECGSEIREGHKFCENCGAPVLRRNTQNLNHSAPEATQRTRAEEQYKAERERNTVSGGNVAGKAIGIVVVAVIVIGVIIGGRDLLFGSSSNDIENFYIEGKWKNVSEESYGQIQPGGILVFNGTNCNLVSPNDTYALSGPDEDGEFTLDCQTYLFGDVQSFRVIVEDIDSINIVLGDFVDLELVRVD